MKLTVWTYEGPPHVGAMRVATAMKGLHYVLHAPQGDTYADLLFTMIERRNHRPPVSYKHFKRVIWAPIQRPCSKLPVRMLSIDLGRIEKKATLLMLRSARACAA